MARGEGLSRRGVKEWFSGLDFESQKAVLSEFEASFEEAKAGRIKVLQAEIEALGGKTPTAAVAAAKPSMPAKAKRGGKPGVKIPPKYIDRATGTTWAGRGVKPAWVEAHLKKGGKLEDLLIAKKKGR